MTSSLSYSYCYTGRACKAQSEPVLTAKEQWGGEADWPSKAGVAILSSYASEERHHRD